MRQAKIDHEIPTDALRYFGGPSEESARAVFEIMADLHVFRCSGRIGRQEDDTWVCWIKRTSLVKHNMLGDALFNDQAHSELMNIGRAFQLGFKSGGKWACDTIQKDLVPRTRKDRKPTRKTS